MSPPPKTLVAPLNWGLGHATRCMPVIRALQARGAEVVLASDGNALAFLEKEFPALTCHALPGYGIRYPAGGAMAKRMLWSTPKILAAIRREHAVVERIVEKEDIGLIVSDNRYGCHSDGVPSVFLSHQVNLQCPAHLKWLEPAVNRMQRGRIGRFDHLWIPDFEHTPNLAGALAHPAPAGAVYVGPLSRMDPQAPADPSLSSDVLVVCSGPEPQRTLFEKKMYVALRGTDHKAVVVRGIVDGPPVAATEGRTLVYNWLPSAALAGAIRAAGTVVCRPGYSTIMDLVRLGKRAVFVPTPGQTEQEYLATYYLEQKLFYSESQEAFDLRRALAASETYPGLSMAFGQDLLDTAVEALLRDTV